MRKIVGALIALVASLAFAGSAAAAVNPLTDGVFGGELPCVKNGSTKVIECSGGGGSPDDPVASNRAVERTVPSWDGTPIDINFALPDADKFGPGPYPLAMYFHGFGGGKEGFGGDLKRFTEKGMAAFSMTERGFKFSCGKKNAVQTLIEDTPGACDNGFIHLMDIRYEVRDAQYFAGLLADEGLIIPDKIGSVGASYGGAKSMGLGSLKNRIMLPDGSTEPWKSPAGKQMEIAVAAPIVPPTDFAYSLVPNGMTLDYTTLNPYGPQNADGTFAAGTKFGVMKAGIINALFGAGDNFSGDYPELGFTVTDKWDVRRWRLMMSEGEPYGTGANSAAASLMLNEMTRYHSSYYVDDSVAPAPMIIAEGFTDDLFPVDEALRFYNKAKTVHPDSTVALLFADIGHPRAPLAGPAEQGRPEDKEMGFQRVDSWFSHYLLGQGGKPAAGIEIKTQVCPYIDPPNSNNPDDIVPSGGPYTATSWAALTPGELRLTNRGQRVIEAAGGTEAIATKFTVLFDACTQVAATREPGVIELDFPVARDGGYTLAGSPTVTADISVANGAESQIAARLLEIDGSQERMIARGVYRPDRSGRQVFQLHGNGYHFAPGTRARLQLLPRDGRKDPLQRALDAFRPSNDQQDIKVTNLDVRLPVMEKPGSLGGLVKKPLAKPLPNGRKLMSDYRSIGGVRMNGAVAGAKKGKAKGKVLIVKVNCGKASFCKAGKVTVKGKGKLKGVVAKGKAPAMMQGASKNVRLKLTRKARKSFRNKKRKIRRRGKVRVKRIKGLKKGKAKIVIKGGGQTNRGNLKIKRTGKVR